MFDKNSGWSHFLFFNFGQELILLSSVFCGSLNWWFSLITFITLKLLISVKVFWPSRNKVMSLLVLGLPQLHQHLDRQNSDLIFKCMSFLLARVIFLLLFILLVFPVAVPSYPLLVHIQSKFLEQSQSITVFFLPVLVNLMARYLVELETSN